MHDLAARIAVPLGVLLCLHGARAALPRDYPAPGSDILSQEPDPAQLCRAAISAIERNTRIPDAFLAAMGRVESGRPTGGALSPWPWTVNAAGSGHFYPTKQAAIDAVRQFQAAGIHSVDVGCLQVNLFYHPDAFASLEQAFDPASNAAFAAKLLLDLFAATGSWPRAAAAYHSMTPALGQAYQQKVLEEWAVPDRPSKSEERLAARTTSKPHAPQAVVQEGEQQAIAPAQTPAALRAVASGAAPPTLGFNRRFLLPAVQMATGRSLAAYRAMPVQLAWRQTNPPAALPQTP